MLQYSTKHFHVFILYLLDLLSPNCHIERSCSVHPFTGPSLFLADASDFLEKDPVLSLDLCIFVLDQEVLFGILIDESLVGLHVGLIEIGFGPFGKELIQSFPMVIHPMVDL